MKVQNINRPYILSRAVKLFVICLGILAIATVTTLTPMTCFADITATSWSPGRFDIFYHSASGDLSTKWYYLPSAGGMGALPGELTSSPIAVNLGEGELRVFYRSPSGSLILRSLHNGGWQPERDLGGQLAEAPTACVNQNTPRVFYQGTGGELFEVSEIESTPVHRALGTRLVGTPSVLCSSDGRIDIAYRGVDNSLRRRWYIGGWSGEVLVSGPISGTPKVVTWGIGSIGFFYRGEDGYLRYQWKRAGRWSGEQNLSVSSLGSPAVTALENGSTLVLFRTEQNRLVVIRHNGENWSSPIDVIGGVYSEVAAVSTSSTRVDFAFLNNTGTVKTGFIEGESISAELRTDGVIEGDFITFTPSDFETVSPFILQALEERTSASWASLLNSWINSPNLNNDLLDTLDGSIQRYQTLVVVDFEHLTQLVASGVLDPWLPDDQEELAGTLLGNGSVSESGGFRYQIPISIPPGAGDVSPKLSLSYDSAGPNGLLGRGWSLSGLSEISRCRSTIVQDGFNDGVDFDINDKFCLDGQRLVAVVGEYGADGTEYRTERDSFDRIVSYGQSGSGPEYFRVWKRRGAIYEYGNSNDSSVRAVIDGVNGQSRYRWRVNRISDRNENFLTIHYNHNLTTGESYPREIVYTGNSLLQLAPYNRVMFEYESRPDKRSSYVFGSLQTNTQRLKSIHVEAEETLAWTYHLTYETDSLLGESRVRSVTECDSLGKCLKPTTFDWSDTTPGDFVSGSVLSDLSPQHGYSDTKQYPTVSGDWNGDGKSDIARVHRTGVLAFTSNGSTFDFYSHLENYGPEHGYADNDVAPLIIGDWNGDGLSDIARVHHTGVSAHLSNGQGFIPFTFLHDIAPQQGFHNGHEFPLLTGDWNGDGRTDLARVSNDGVVVYISVEDGFQHYFTFHDFGRAQGYADSSIAPIVTGDWNGDGLTDIARIHHTGVIALITEGAGFSYYTHLRDLSPEIGYTNSYSFPFVTGDWNGDGLTDIGRVNNSSFVGFVSTGREFLHHDTFEGIAPAQGYRNSNDAPLIPIDVNGDGRTDLVRIHHEVTTIVLSNDSGFSYEPRMTSSGMTPSEGYLTASTHPLLAGDWNGDGVADFVRVHNSGVVPFFRTAQPNSFVTRVTDGLGRTSRIDYDLLTNDEVYEKGSGTHYPATDNQFPFRVVRTYSIDNGIGGDSVSHYQYYALRSERTGRGSCGFERISVTDETTGVKLITSYRQDYPYKGLTFKSEKYLANGTLLSRSEDTWDVLWLDERRYYPYVAHTSNSHYEIEGWLVSRESIATTLDDFGNLTSRTVTHGDGFVEETINSYENRTSEWLLGLVTETVVTRSLPSVAPISRETEFTYDERGLITREVVEPGDPQFELVKDYRYDTFGNVIETTISAAGGAPRVSSTEFDPLGRFPVRDTDALGQYHTRTYNPAHGSVLELTDSSGLTVRWDYNSFGRKVGEYLPNGVTSRSRMTAPDQHAPPFSSYQITNTTSGAPTSVEYFDSTGRILRVLGEGFDGRWIAVDSIYDNRGALTLKSEPYFFGNEPLWTRFEYDAVGRIIRTILPGGEELSVEYFGLTMYSTDAKGRTSTRTSTQRGDTVQTIDASGGVANYQYDSYGNITRVEDHVGNVTSIEYDKAGRRIALSDPDSGTTVSTYNAFGELVSTTDMAGNQVNYVFDRLGRKIEENLPEGIHRWSYGSEGNSKGRLSVVEGRNGYRLELSYDAFGREIGLAETIKGVTYTVSKSYDEFGRISELTYPSGFRLRYHYNERGFLTEIVDAATGESYWQIQSEGPRGELIEALLGNGIPLQRSYDPLTGRIQGQRVGTLSDLHFEFDSVGNLLERREQVLGLTEQFNYDSLNRLTRSEVLGQSPVTIQYDSLGNIVQRSDIGSYSYGEGDAGPHAVTSIVGPKSNTFSYDNRGNRVSSLFDSVTYASFGKPLSLKRDETEIRFRYGPNDNRIEQIRFESGKYSDHKVYVGGLFEKHIAGNDVRSVHYIKVGGQTVAIRTTRWGHPPELNYVVLDHLGSPTVLLSSEGEVIERMSFGPWGERRNGNDWSPLGEAFGGSNYSRGFTGHEQLDAVKLVHMNGRLYDPEIGRFLSPDPFIQSPEDLQNLNRYTYVLNNPLSYSDPSGFFFKKLFKIAVSVGVSYLGYSILPGFGQLFANQFIGQFIGAAIISTATSTVTTVLHGGSFSTAFKSSLRAAPFAALAAVGGNILSDTLGSALGGALSQSAISAVAHGVSNATVSLFQGADFAESFASVFVARFGSQYGFIPSVVAAGVASSLSGGKFEDGVMRATMHHLFTYAEHSITTNSSATDGGVSSGSDGKSTVGGKNALGSSDSSGGATRQGSPGGSDVVS